MLSLRSFSLSLCFPGKITQRKISCPPQLPQIDAAKPSAAESAEHVQHIDNHLKSRGIVKIGLQFDDDECTYLDKLIRQLHRFHGHGIPITHSASRGWFWDVCPQPADPTQAHIARSETMNVFPWHTDCSYEAKPPNYFALQVIQPDQCGSGTFSVLDISRLVSFLSPTARKALRELEFRIAVPPEFMKHEDAKYITEQLLQADDGCGIARLRFREDIITPLTPAASIAFQELQRTLTSSKMQSEEIHLPSSMLPRGLIIAMDNRRWLHGRSQVLDPNRHLRRVRSRPFAKL
ncbi:Clavaminate synthase-like protein [Penicillium angulare]|uniref:Clavaminate synthase-like protein n=1 Tax=Penicillium angulare TaxID=116970 RepID=UPI0025418894|nr:Clavaminate synthase-like protein [Penicillium angulare]KAJ5286868.1 Clavaminate synthase-like protein [Penicillium angulare]